MIKSLTIAYNETVGDIIADDDILTTSNDDYLLTKYDVHHLSIMSAKSYDIL